VFALHLYRTVKRLGVALNLRRNVGTGEFSGPFVELAHKAWLVCFQGASQLSSRIVGMPWKERGDIEPVVPFIARK
jgi:hypothetical protein